jgi:hypothetical protein
MAPRYQHEERVKIVAGKYAMYREGIFKGLTGMMSCKVQLEGDTKPVTVRLKSIAKMRADKRGHDDNNSNATIVISRKELEALHQSVLEEKASIAALERRIRHLLETNY